MTDELSTSAQLRQALAERDLARAELASARTELEQLRATREWAVADRYVHDCAICEWSIQRGEAFQPLPGAKGSFRHVLCSRPTQETP